MIVLLTGAPGAGKGTQGVRLAAEFNSKVLSTGDLIRAQIKSGSSLGVKVKDVVESGRLVDDTLMLEIIKDVLLNLDQNSTVIFDGYPRNLKQARDLETLSDLHSVKSVLNVDVDLAVLVKRIAGRRVCGGCGATYNVVTMPPKIHGQCDRCGSKDLTHRKDDQEDKVRVRMDVFATETEAIHDYYREKGVYHKIDGEGDPDEVFARLEKAWKTSVEG